MSLWSSSVRRQNKYLLFCFWAEMWGMRKWSKWSSGRAEPGPLCCFLFICSLTLTTTGSNGRFKLLLVKQVLSVPTAPHVTEWHYVLHPLSLVSVLVLTSWELPVMRLPRIHCQLISSSTCSLTLWSCVHCSLFKGWAGRGQMRRLSNRQHKEQC